MTAKKSQGNLAIDLLIEDHNKFKKMFKDFDKIKDNGDDEEDEGPA